MVQKYLAFERFQGDYRSVAKYAGGDECGYRGRQKGTGEDQIQKLAERCSDDVAYDVYDDDGNCCDLDAGVLTVADYRCHRHGEQCQDKLVADAGITAEKGGKKVQGGEDDYYPAAADFPGIHQPIHRCFLESMCRLS